MDFVIDGNLTQGLSRAFRKEDPWIRHEEIFRDLYCVQRKTLKEVKEEMEMKHGFPPSTPLSTYETKLRDQLMLRKKLSKEDWPVIGNYLRKRKSAGKNSEVFLNKVPLPKSKVQKELRRNKRTVQTEESTDTTLPFGVDIKTPPALLPSSPTQPIQRKPPSNPFSSSNTPATVEQVQKQINNNEQMNLSVPTNSKGLNTALSSRKRPRASDPDCLGPSTKRYSSLFRDSLVNNALSSFQTKAVFDRAKISGIVGMFGDALPYVQLNWILHGEQMTNPVEIPQRTRFAIQNSRNPLGATPPGISCQQLPRDNDRIIHTSPNQESQIGREALSSLDFLKTALYFVSNGLLDLEDKTTLINNLEDQSNQQATVDVLFSIDTPTVRAAWEQLIRLAIEMQSPLFGPLLIAGCRKRKWIAGLAPVLASAAIFFFDSAEAVEHIRRLRRAQVSLVEGGTVTIDLGGGTCLNCPLQQALNKADADIVKELMNDTHLPESVREDGKKRLLYIPENFYDGFDERPEKQRIACLKAMVNCGLRLNEPADHGYDTFHRLGCVPPLDCYNTLDRLHELELVREYDMLLPYSRKFSTSVMVCGILNAARNGDYALSQYFAARTSTMDEDEYEDDVEDVLLLKEIALCKTAFLLQEHRYTTLQCLLRNGVDPNIPYLSRWCLHLGDNYVDTAVRNHDLKYLAILLANGLAIDSAGVLYALFRKFQHDERVVPLSTRLGTLSFLRDNGLDVRTHGMVALAAFLEGGYWSYSDSEVSPHFDEVLTLLRTLLDAAADINMAIDKKGNTIVHATAAAKFGSSAIIAALIESGANIHALNSDGQTALHRAIVSYKPSRLAIVESLLKHGAVTTYQGQGLTLLEELVIYSRYPYQHEHINIAAPFAMLLSWGACINNPNAVAGSSALALLIEKRMPTELINMALEADADVNAPAVLTSGIWPVEAALKTTNYPVLRILLNRGANINTPPVADGSLTMLQSACFGHNITIVQDLIAQGADVNAAARDDNGVTALQAAAMTGHIDIAKILIENGALLDLPPAAKNGNLPLDGAARMGRLDMVQYLMNLGAFSQESGATRYDGAIKLAEREGHYAIADLMREHAARLDKDQSWWADCLDDAAMEGFFADISQRTSS